MSLDLDEFLSRHLHGTQAKSRRMIKYSADELHELAATSIDTFKKEGSLVRMNPPCVVVGDIHGQFQDLLRMFSLFATPGDKNGHRSGAIQKKFLFVGDYIDRGTHSLECLSLVLALKIRFPLKYQLLRGNHETAPINLLYGFNEDLIKRFGNEEGQKLYDTFNDVFAWMPLAGLVGDKILCMHGGISPHLQSLEDIEQIERPLKDVSENPLALDLIWSDPSPNVSGFPFNKVRGCSCYFGEREVTEACKKLNLSLIVRGHQMMMSGFGFFANRKLVTIFTAPRYNTEEKNKPNKGAVLDINEKAHIGMVVLDPLTNGTGRSTDNTKSSTSKNSSVSAGKTSKGAAKKARKLK